MLNCSFAYRKILNFLILLTRLCILLTPVRVMSLDCLLSLCALQPGQYTPFPPDSLTGSPCHALYLRNSGWATLALAPSSPGSHRHSRSQTLPLPGCFLLIIHVSTQSFSSAKSLIAWNTFVPFAPSSRMMDGECAGRNSLQASPSVCAFGPVFTPQPLAGSPKCGTPTVYISTYTLTLVK